MSRTHIALLLGASALAGSALLLWSQRVPIAEQYIARDLATRGIRATYRLSKISATTQRIDDVVIGDPARPDLTARSIEVDLGYRGLVPRVVAVRAHGVRVFGTVRDGRLHLGDLDRLMSEGKSDAPFALPDIGLSLSDARARIDTPFGPVGVSVAGAGRLSGGFAGKIAAVTRNAQGGGCTVPMASAYLDITTRAGAPHIAGPVRAPALGCGGLTLADLNARVDARASASMDRFSGRVAAQARGAGASGTTLASPRLDLHFDGTARDMAGRFAVDTQGAGTTAVASGPTRAQGTWAIGPAGWRMQGQGSARDIAPRHRAMLDTLGRAGQGSPVGPLTARLAEALRAASRANSLGISYSAQGKGNAGSARLTRLAMTSQSGARIALSPGGSVDLGWPGGRWALNGAVESGGGGIPDARLNLAPRAGGGLNGRMTMAPYAAQGARLALAPVVFTAARDGALRMTSSMTLDGPVAGGSLSGLSFPLDMTMRGGVVRLNRACGTVRLARVRHSALSADNLSLALCPLHPGGMIVAGSGGVRGGAMARDLSLALRLGQSPAQIKARMAQVDIAAGRFALADMALTLGKGTSPMRLSAARLDGTGAQGGMRGTASGLAAQIGAVPLLIRDGDARWSYGGDALRVGGGINILDAASPDRFNPMRARDFALTMARGQIAANGTLTLPGKDAPIARVVVRHMLGSGRGSADIALDTLRFGPALQPEEISRLALGVVANVNGTVTGAGRIDWTGAGAVTSSGSFATDDTSLAAAFGPVSGLATRITFTDLLGLVTAPGQVATMKSVNPGVEVVDGRIAYALRAGQQVAIEGGHWPFAGGELTLLPTVMDFGADRARNLTFRVTGLDAGAFINTMELDNVSATGTFDGLLPMIFDATGGRITGGILVARQAGNLPLVVEQVAGLDIPCDPTRQAGSLSYVGQVSNENLGRMGKMAFDALKDLQYRCLTILMDGAIDGEVVTQVAFNGLNKGELSSVPRVIARQFIGLPFIFNIRIEAPFRGLMNTARSFVDPGLLIRSHLGNQYAPVVQNRLAVQPRESDIGVTGDRK